MGVLCIAKKYQKFVALTHEKWNITKAHKFIENNKHNNRSAKHLRFRHCVIVDERKKGGNNFSVNEIKVRVGELSPRNIPNLLYNRREKINFIQQILNIQTHKRRQRILLKWYKFVFLVKKKKNFLGVSSFQRVLREFRDEENFFILKWR